MIVDQYGDKIVDNSQARQWLVPTLLLCPVGIDITEEAAALRVAEAAEHNG